ncbi:MAG: alpha-amylase domain-containing protein [Ferruginibacter sp.]
MSNGEAGNKKMEMGKRYAGKVFIDALKKVSAEVIINEEGWGDFFINAGTVSVWINKDQSALFV